MKQLDIYSDGSFSSDSQRCMGAYVILDGDQLLCAQRINVVKEAYKESWQIAGELFSVIFAMNKCVGNFGEDIKIVLHYDYIGIEKYVHGDKPWAAKKLVTKLYAMSFEQFRKSHPRVIIEFRKVKAHSGIYWNEIVDALANDRIPNKCEGKLLETVDV